MNRKQGEGCMLRGDLPIAPHCGNWFTVSANPSQDLRTGAINAMSGVNNETSKDMAALLAASGNTNVGGVSLSTQELSSLGSDLSTLNVTSFA